MSRRVPSSTGPATQRGDSRAPERVLRPPPDLDPRLRRRRHEGAAEGWISPLDGTAFGLDLSGVPTGSAAPTQDLPRILPDGQGGSRPLQMPLREFHHLLESRLNPAVDAALRGSAWRVDPGSRVREWFNRAEFRTAADIQEGIERYAPGRKGRTAPQLAEAFTDRVATDVRGWVQGRATPALPRGFHVALEARRSAREFQLLPERISLNADRSRSAPPEPGSALPGGRTLEPGVRRRMEGAFGADLSAVRVHAGVRPQEMHQPAGTRAFALGHRIAFAPGSYRPGTPSGDALIAHEVAHVLQQEEGTRGSVPGGSASGGTRERKMEEDANRAAAHAVLHTRGAPGGLGSAELGERRPALRSGLRLRRCSSPFPSYREIVSDPVVQSETDAAWARTESATTETFRREEGFWIQLDTATGRYSTEGHVVDHEGVPPDRGASLTPGPKPADVPGEEGGTYTVAFFHTHTPTVHRAVGRGVGPSDADERFHTSQNVVGVVYDYVASPPGSGSIPAGHPLGSRARRYHSGPNRRAPEPG